ncbi:hypothetical protein AURDEDRAFT_165600 [Auricularia subglabra TFB-10046 SS5]|nr:hypothetical protein AURDEDRAFT_165600 [Auricularia subglabra TFB-10046 SS5]
MSSLFECDLDKLQLIVPGGDPVIPIPTPFRPATPSEVSLYLEGYTPICSTIPSSGTVDGVKSCPSTEETLCTQCGAKGDHISVTVDRATGTAHFACVNPDCFGLVFARWNPLDEKFNFWCGVVLESAPNPTVQGPLNRVLQLKVFDLSSMAFRLIHAHIPSSQNDGWFLEYKHHNTEWFSFDDLPDLLVNSRLAFGSPKAIEFRRRIRKKEYRWLPFTKKAGEFLIGKQRKLEFRIVNSTVPTPFRITHPDSFASLLASTNEIPTDPEDEVPYHMLKPTCRIPTCRIPAAGELPSLVPAAPPTAGMSTASASTAASPAASITNRAVIDLTLSDGDEPPAATVSTTKISPIILVVDSDNDTPTIAVGQKRKHDDTVIGKEKKIKREKKSKGKENKATL